MKRRDALIGAAGVAAAAAGASWHALHPGAAGATAVSPASTAEVGDLWTLSFVRPEGGNLAMASLRGRPLLLNFWATWCAPCVKEMPELDRFQRSFGQRGGQVVGLAIDGPTPVREFLKRVPVTFPIGLAGFDGTDLSRRLGNAQGALPFTVLIGAAGGILQRKLGETNLAELSKWVAAL